MDWTDSHCHLEGFRKSGTLLETLERAHRAGVSQIVAIGTDCEDWTANLEMACEHCGKIFYTVGLHPNHVDENWQFHVENLPSFFDHETKPVAVGEVGLDYFRLPKKGEKAIRGKAFQKAALREQLTLARSLGVPVVIHCRDAFADCVAEIDASGISWTKVVFHCFSEGPHEMSKLIDRGGRASFTGIVTFYGAENVRVAAKLQGIENLMIETDSPYLAPEPLRGNPNEPANLPHIGIFLSKLLDVEEAELAATTTRNTQQFYGLPE